MPNPLRRRLVVVSLAFALNPLAARAQQFPPDPDIDQGLVLRQQQRDAEALVRFQRAWERTHSPRSSGLMGFAEIALGRWVDADTHLREALAHPADAWVTLSRGTLDAALQRVAGEVGALEVLGGVPGAEVVFHGAVVGRLPMLQPVTVLAETTTLEVRAAGHAPFRRNVTVSAGRVTRETVTLAPETAAHGGTPDAPPASNASGALRVAGITGAALGGVALVGGVVAWVLRENAAGQYNDDARCNRDARTRDQECPGERSNVETLSTLAGVGVGVGMAVGIAGAVMLGVSGGRAEAAPGAVWLTSGPGVFGLGIAGVF